MYSKGFKTILLFLALGFSVIWFLEFRRTTLADSYWALLVMLLCLFWYQFINLKMGSTQSDEKPAEPQKNVATKSSKKRKK